MLFYKKLFTNKISVAGAGGGGGSPEPSYLMPPDGAFTKVGFQLYEALDLICEGPILGLSDQKGRVLIDSLRAKKDFTSSSNVIGSSTEGIDKGIYFANKPLRDERNSPNLGKYDVSLQLGKEFQEAPLIGAFPQRVRNVSTPVKGPYDMTNYREPAWLYSQTVYRIANSGWCSGYVHFQREQYSAILAKNLTFLGRSVGNGYIIINNTSARALYRVVNTYIGAPNYRKVVPFRTDQLRPDGRAICNAGPAGIHIARVDPARPSGYGSAQIGIGSGVRGIGTYGVFARTLDTIDGTGPWYQGGPQQVNPSTLIGTITKAGEEDIYNWTSVGDSGGVFKPTLY